MRRERQSSTCGCNEMRERQRKDRGEILNEDGRELGWLLKKIWERRDRMEKETGRDRKKNVIFFWICYFYF
jgi:hypothetical protein